LTIRLLKVRTKEHEELKKEVERLENAKTSK